jgi:hypothetical protein
MNDEVKHKEVTKEEVKLQEVTEGEDTKRIEVDALGLDPRHIEALNWFTDFLVTMQEGQTIMHGGSREIVHQWLAIGEILGLGHMLPHTVMVHDEGASTTALCLIMCGDDILLEHLEAALDEIDLEAVERRVKDPLKYN